MKPEASPPEAERNLPPAAAPSWDGTAESECLAVARELQAVLEEETRVLKRFAGKELLRLIAKKEFLVEELRRKLNALKTDEGRPFSLSSPLKSVLGTIDSRNNANRTLIEGTLSYWQDFLSFLIPAAYGPNGEETAHATSTPKGLSFSREV